MKVLVRSIYRGVTAKTGEYPVRTKDGTAVMEAITRPFFDYQSYMTPEEAQFLIESDENRKARAKGQAWYYYPAGIPVPVADDHDGPLAPAGTTATTVAADPAQATAAAQQMERAERILAEREAAINAGANIKTAAALVAAPAEKPEASPPKPAAAAAK